MSKVTDRLVQINPRPDGTRLRPHPATTLIHQTAKQTTPECEEPTTNTRAEVALVISRPPRTLRTTNTLLTTNRRITVEGEAGMEISTPTKGKSTTCLIFHPY